MDFNPVETSFEKWAKPGQFSRTLAKGPKTTTWIWNLHADAHDFDIQTNSLQEVSRKSVNALKSWKETNPDYEDADSAFSNKCLAIQQQSIAGTNREQYYPKIIKNVAKELIVDKQNVNQDELDNGQVTNGFVK